MERSIVHEVGDYWVQSTRKGYVVMRPYGTASISDSTYARTEDGLSLAIARCDYLAKR